MKETPIHLGFEVVSGEPIAVPLSHLVVFGQTQSAGKTTALEALISRSGCKAIAFVTKRGEGGFSNAHEIRPYFRERADWQFVQAVIEATVNSKQDFKLPWIMRACEGTKTLAGVQRNVKRLLDKAKGMSLDMYYVLDNYLDLVIPQIASLPKADTVALTEGLNVMSLDGYSPELQALVIRSVIDWVHKKEHGVVTVIPEAWRFLPQGRRSPVRLAAEELIREGAALKNFVWIDSQDIAGVDKLPLRAAKVWLIGVQREPNELKRNLEAIPAGFKRPKANDVASLKLGQFFACWGDEAHKVYVQPAWMGASDARAIAMGKKRITDASAERIARSPAQQARTLTDETGTVARAGPQHLDAHPDGQSGKNAVGNAAREPTGNAGASVQTNEEELDVDRLDRIERLLETMVSNAKVGEALTRCNTEPTVTPANSANMKHDFSTPLNGDEESLYQRFKARLMRESPGLIQLLAERPEIEVEVERQVLKMDGSSLPGRCAKLVAGKFFDTPRTHSAVRKELERTGPQINFGNLTRELKNLVARGFLTDEADGYRAVAGMKVNVVER